MIRLGFAPPPAALMVAPAMEQDFEAARLTVRLDAVADNYRTFRRLAGPAAVAAIVKADAYGLGAAAVAPALGRAGCDSFFVAPDFGPTTTQTWNFGVTEASAHSGDTFLYDFLFNTPLLYVFVAIGLVFIFIMVNGISTGISDSNPISSAFVNRLKRSRPFSSRWLAMNIATPSTLAPS